MPYQSVGFHSHVSLLHEHFQMTQRVYYEPSRLDVLERLVDKIPLARIEQEIWRGADQPEQILLFPFPEIPTEVFCIPVDLVRQLFKSHVHSWLALFHAVNQVLERKSRLSRSSASGNHDCVSLHESAVEHFVELYDARFHSSAFSDLIGEQLILLRVSRGP